MTLFPSSRKSINFINFFRKGNGADLQRVIVGMAGKQLLMQLFENEGGTWLSYQDGYWPQSQYFRFPLTLASRPPAVGVFVDNEAEVAVRHRTKFTGRNAQRRPTGRRDRRRIDSLGEEQEQQ